MAPPLCIVQHNNTFEELKQSLKFTCPHNGAEHIRACTHKKCYIAQQWAARVMGNAHAMPPSHAYGANALC